MQRFSRGSTGLTEVFYLEISIAQVKSGKRPLLRQGRYDEYAAEMVNGQRLFKTGNHFCQHALASGLIHQATLERALLIDPNDREIDKIIG